MMPSSFFRRCVLAAGILSVPTFAQVCDSRASTTQIQVQLMFSADTASESAPGLGDRDSARQGDTAGAYKQPFDNTSDIRVQLYEQLGGLVSEASPNTDGKLRINVCRNSRYMLRVTGSTIQEVTVDSVQANRGDRLLTIVLHKKLSKQEQKTHKAMVAASRLRIPRRARKEFKKGNDALERERLDKAEAHFRRAIQLYPDYDEAQNSLGMLLMRQGRRTEGKQAFLRAATINPRYAVACINLAKIGIDDKDFPAALDYARQALTSEPVNPAALFVAAEAAFFTNSFAETVRYTRALHDLPHPSYALAHYLAGKSLQMQQLDSDAAAEYRRFLEEDPSDPNALRAAELLQILLARDATGSTSHLFPESQ
jgi:tetratricopeptide (TPR) repeat protein